MKRHYVVAIPLIIAATSRIAHLGTRLLRRSLRRLGVPLLALLQWRRPPLIPWLVASAALLAACTDRPSDAPRPGYGQLRSPFELQRIKAHPQSCGSASDCPTGSRCDTTKAVCDWDCMSDSDCDHGQICDAVGSCVASFTNVARSNDSATLLVWQSISAEQPGSGISRPAF